MSPPEITIDVSPVSLGERSIASDAEALRFDLQLLNLGDEELVINEVRLRGDGGCAFTLSDPDQWSLYRGESSFVRGWYQPTTAGEDHVALEVESNAANFPLLVVPVCGRGVAEVGEQGAPVECLVPEETAADCGE